MLNLDRPEGFKLSIIHLTIKPFYKIYRHVLVGTIKDVCTFSTFLFVILLNWKATLMKLSVE
jgi:hypothetical protein